MDTIRRGWITQGTPEPLENPSRLAEAEPLMRRMVGIFIDFTMQTGHAHPHLQTAIGNYAGLLEVMGRTEAEIREKIGKLLGPLGTGDIASIMLASLHGQLQTANAQVPDLEVALSDAQIERLRVFQSKKPLPDGSHSLRDRWVRIKKAVSSQYGRDSAQYELVKGIKY